MTHKIFKVLDEYNLLKPYKRLQTISELSENDINSLTDKLSVAVERRIKNEDNDFIINMPYPSLELMKEIPDYLFICDKVYTPDPLVDYLYSLSKSDEEIVRLIERFHNTSLNKLFKDASDRLDRSMSFRDKYDINLNEIIRSKQIKKVDKMINYYISYRDLIDEGVFVPFTDSTIGYDSDAIDMAFARGLELIGPRFEQNFNQLNNKLNSRIQSLDDVALAVKEIVVEYFQNISEEQWNELMYLSQYIPTTLALKEFFPSKGFENLAFGGDQNRKHIDNAVQLLGEWIDEKETAIVWPAPEDEILFSTISNIPPQELLAIRYAERDALQKYRFIVQEKLIDIRNTLGTKEHSDIIRKFSLEQRKQVTEISMLANHIQKDHLRKSSFQITTTLLSAAGAILSAIVSTQDPLALVGTGIASAGFTAGISKLIETWISYKSEMDKLREKDSYILWKLHKDK